SLFRTGQHGTLVGQPDQTSEEDQYDQHACADSDTDLVAGELHDLRQCTARTDRHGKITADRDQKAYTADVQRWPDNVFAPLSTRTSPHQAAFVFDNGDTTRGHRTW